MKKITSLVMSFIFAILLCGCTANDIEPNISQLRTICNLATLECHYHNVARSTKTAGQGITHIFEKDRKYWIESTGVAKIGIDISEIEMTVKKYKVKVSLPSAKLLSIDILESDFNEESVISSEDGFLNKNKITADEQKSAVNDAQNEMKENVNNNTQLLLNAQERAKKLIENYINKIGDMANIDYEIEWVTKNNK